MSESTLPPIEGRAVSVYKGDIQAAIEAAKIAYHKKFGIAPTHIALPYGQIEPSAIDLDGLNLARHAGPGVVIVGRVVGDKPPEQLTLL